MFSGVAKLAGNKQNVLLPQWLNEETLFPKTNELRMRLHLCCKHGAILYNYKRPRGLNVDAV